MCNHMLVPLDGSHLAEAVLPAVVYLSRTLGASVTLLHCIERHAPPAVHGDRHMTSAREADSYLDGLATQMFPADQPVDRHVHTTEVQHVAQSIVAHAGEFQADLIVLCTHGRGGLTTALSGSIAQQVLALGNTPVLLIQPDAAEAYPAFTCQRMLVALDGNPDHERSLVVATGLARACGAETHLITVIPTRQTLPSEQAATALLLPSATSAMLDLTQPAARAYLHQHVEQMHAAGLTAQATVQRGDPAGVIAHVAQQEQVDLIVLGTHGKTHMDAFWSGSITPRLVRQTRVPLLLVPVRA